MARRKQEEEEQLPPHMMGPPVEFKAKGGTDQENQANLIQARQSMGIVAAKVLYAEALSKAADRILLDYTREGVARRLDVDGFWHQMPPMDRQNGDLLLAVLKKISNLNPAERRAKQVGEFGVSYRTERWDCEIVSQGTPTGERVILKISNPKKSFENLTELGVRDQTLEKFRYLVGRHIDDQETLKKGLFIFCAPPSGGGLSTLWKMGLGGTDRYMRDFVCIEDEHNREPEVENIELVSYDSEAGETPVKMLPRILLKQPDVLVVPHIPDAETLKQLLVQVNKEDRMVFTCTRAKDSAEGLLRLMQLKPNPKEFASAVTGVLNMRLIRKLCEKCKQPYQPHPQLMQKLGIPPGRVPHLYQQWQPPPPGSEPEDPKKKKKGEEEEPQICQACSGLGYRGRTGFFELLVVDDAIRKVLREKPDVNAIRQLARQAGTRTLQEEGIVLLARGVTSLPELQRVMKS